MEIFHYCESKPIMCGFSVFDLESLKAVFNIADDVDFHWIKIPSCMMTNLKLINAACLKNCSIILSNGGTTMKQCDKVMEVVLRKKNPNNVCLMHCNSSYPAQERDMNLKNITMLQKRYGVSIGLSDHSFGLETSVIGAMLGAKIIEKHVTLDRTMWGTDQGASVEPPGMYKLRKRLDAIPVLLGSEEKIITKEEELVMQKCRGK